MTNNIDPDTNPMSVSLQVPASVYAMVDFKRAYLRFGAVSGALMMCLFVLYLIDVRWLLVALLTLMAGIPALLTITWLSLISKPDTASLSRPQRWSFSKEGALHIEFYDFEDSDCASTPVSMTKIEPHQICGIESGRRYTVIHLASGAHYKFIIIPTNLAHAVLIKIDSLNVLNN